MVTRRGSFRMDDLGIRGILLIIAIVCFVIAALGIDLGRIDAVALGLAFFAGAFLVER